MKISKKDKIQFNYCNALDTVIARELGTYNLEYITVGLYMNTYTYKVIRSNHIYI